jgi:transcriptional regulator
MYSLPQYKEKDHEKVIAFMKEHPFVSLVGVDGSGRIEFTQLPVMVKERDGEVVIQGHIAKKLDHEKAIRENPEVLAVFTGPHSYISGKWYIGNLQQASTWNYISVHARGKVRWMSDQELVDLLREFTLYFENNDRSSNTIYDNLPEEYIQRIIKGIVGFEFVVTELENVFKLSQTRDKASYMTIIEKLSSQDEAGKYIAEKMRENIPRIFQD